MVSAVDDKLPAPAADSPSGVSEQSGSRDAGRDLRVRQMVDQHLPTVWRLLRRIGLSTDDADDAIQEIILVAVRKLEAIEPACERQFLLRTAYRVGCRLRARRPEVGAEELADPLPHADVLVDQRRARELLDDILARMSVELRTVFALHDIEGLTMAEIAETLEISPGTVASRLRRAREDFERHVARAEARMKAGGKRP